MIYLNKIFRQSDIVFVNILNEMRCGCLSSDSISFLQRKCDEDVTRELEFPTESQFATAKIKIAPTRLFSINNQVDDLNNRELNKLELPEVTYHAKDVGTEHHLRTLRQGLKVPDRLNLRVGAQVNHCGVVVLIIVVVVVAVVRMFSIVTVSCRWICDVGYALEEFRF